MNQLQRVFFVCVMLCAASSAHAQQQAITLSPPSILPAPASYEGGPLVMPPMAQQGRVPELPPSRTCGPSDISGLWKLLQVYEEPQGPETTLFYTTPSQYMNFNADSTFEMYEKSKDTQANVERVRSDMKQQIQGLQQYVIQTGGQLYFYRDSVAIKQQACFIVVSGNNFYAHGQMLLMPPNAQSPTRWVKVYSKVWTRPAQAAAPLPSTDPVEKSPFSRGPDKRKRTLQ